MDVKVTVIDHPAGEKTEQGNTAVSLSSQGVRNASPVFALMSNNKPCTTEFPSIVHPTKPQSAITTPDKIAGATLGSVARQQGVAALHTPNRVHTPKACTPLAWNRTPLARLLRHAQSPVTPPARVKVRPKIDLGTPSRVQKTTNPALTAASQRLGPVPNTSTGDSAIETEDKEENTEDKSTDVSPSVSTTASVKSADVNGNMDIRSFWKTKKTPQKSPVLKEVLTTDVSQVSWM